MMMSVLAVACAEGMAVTSDNNSVRIAEMAAATRGADARGSAIDEEGNTIGTPCVPWKAEAGSWVLADIHGPRPKKSLLLPKNMIDKK